MAYPAHPAAKDRAEDAPLGFWRPFIDHQMPLPEHFAAHEPVMVTMNHGRWLAVCPFCGSAQYPSVTDHRFFCVDCGNRGLGWLKTVWPANPDAIESEMELREPANRNLDAGENESDLRDENRAHFEQIVKTPEERLLDTWAAAEASNAEVRPRIAKLVKAQVADASGEVADYGDQG